MKSRNKTIFLLIINLLIIITNQQSTSNVPPGYCANYLNRYTKENQCIYR